MPVLKNAQHERFAQELANGVCASTAYVNAGYAYNLGNSCRLKNNAKVQARVEEILGRAATKLEITKARVLEELGRIGFSDIRKLFSESGNLLPIHELDDDAAASLSAIEVVTRKVPGGEEAEVEHVAKIKTWDKRAALADICKIMGWQVEKHEHSGPNGGAIKVADVSDNEAARRIAFLLAKATKSP